MRIAIIPAITVFGGPHCGAGCDGSRRFRSARNQVATSEIVNGKVDALEVIPPDHGRNAGGMLPDRRRRLPQDRQSVILLQRTAVVILHSLSHQLVVVTVQ